MMFLFCLLAGKRKSNQLNCGLAGVFGDTFLSQAEKDPVKLLMFLNMLRGVDSTGMYSVWQRGGKQRVSFEATTDIALDFLAKKEVEDLFKLNMTTVIATHTRAATFGSVTDENAQPIFEGKIIGCHNGTVDAFKGDAQKMECSDSRILMRNINKYGIEGMVKEAGYNNAAFALTYVDLEEGTFNIMRNAHRPLWLMYKKDGSCFYWSSERRMLVFMADREGLKDFDDPHFLKQDHLFTFELGNVDSLQEKEIKPPAKIYLPPLRSHLGRHRDNTPPFVMDTDDASSTKLIIKDEQKDEAELEKLAAQAGKKWKSKKLPRFYDNRRNKFYTFYKGFDNKIYRAGDINSRLHRQGCSGCTAGTLTVTSDVWWATPDSFFCAECRNDPMVVEYAKRNKPLFKGQLCGAED